MMMNGPKIKLNSAPGRRMTSMTSLMTNAVVRVQLLSGPRNSSVMLFSSLLVLVRAGGLGARDQSGEDFVKRGVVFPAGDDAATGGLDGFDQAWGNRCGVVRDDQELTRRTLPYLANAGQVVEIGRVERGGGAEFDHVTAERLAAQCVRWRQSDQLSTR